jgi:hypothetical protein
VVGGTVTCGGAGGAVVLCACGAGAARAMAATALVAAMNIFINTCAS